MLNGLELMEWIEHFGRCNVQELVAKRQDMRDVITYLRVERSLELAKAMSFATSDSVSFEQRTGFPLIADEVERCVQY